MTATTAADVIARHLAHYRPASEHEASQLYREAELGAESTSLLGRAFAVMRTSEDELTIRGFARIHRHMLRSAVNSAA